MKKICIRILSVPLTILSVSLIVFAVLSVSSGSAAFYVLGDEADSGSVSAFERAAGLDRPFLIRYASFLFSFLQGNWGKTITGHDIYDLVMARLEPTAAITAMSLLIALLIAVPVSLFSLRQNSVMDRAATSLSVLFMSLPSFLTAIFLTIVFSVHLHLFPSSGYTYLSDGMIPHLSSIILPSLTLAFLHASLYIRIFRECLRENVCSLFSRGALALGFGRRESILLAIKPSMPVLLSLITESIAASVAGAAVTETVFSVPGTGQLMVTAALSRDSGLAAALMILIAGIISVLYAVLEIVLPLVDPRAGKRE